MVAGALDDAALRALASCLDIPQPEFDTYIPPNSLIYFPMETGLDDVMGNVVLSHQFSTGILNDTGLANRGRRALTGGAQGAANYFTYKYDFAGNITSPSPTPDDTYNIETISDAVYNASSGTVWFVLVIDTDATNNDFFNMGLDFLRDGDSGPPSMQAGLVGTTVHYNGATGLLVATRSVTSGNSDSERPINLDLSSIKDTGLYTLLIACTVDGNEGSDPMFYNSFTDTHTAMIVEDGNTALRAGLFYNSIPPEFVQQNYKFNLKTPYFPMVSMKQAGVLTGNTSLSDLRAMRDNLVLDI
jgi:hypothetical protein